MWSLIPLLLVGAAPVILAGQGLVRLQCQGSPGNMRVDPIKAPGHPSEHVHWIEGGSAFSMTSDRSALRASSCSSCHVQQDRSAYWAPALYFQHSNGSFEQVKNDGGMLVYYKYYDASYRAFPPGFRMIAGHSRKRSSDLPDTDPPTSSWTPSDQSQDVLSARALGFNCLHYARPAEPTLGRHRFPDKSFLDANCADGLRLEIQFPSCSNGALDSPDHASHVAYPNLLMGGSCPDTHPVQLVSLMYETKWRTDYFAGVPGEFVLSNGDATGFGYHGDFMEAWDEGVLQAVMDTCQPGGNDDQCPVLTLVSQDEMLQCKMPVPDALKDENVLYPGDQLPNCVQVHSGPEDAPPVKGCDAAPAAAAPPPAPYGAAAPPPATLATSKTVAPEAQIAAVQAPAPATTTTPTSHSSSPAPDPAATEMPILAEGAKQVPVDIVATKFTTLAGGQPMEVLYAETTVVELVTLTEWVPPTAATAAGSAGSAGGTTTTEGSDGMGAVRGKEMVKRAAHLRAHRHLHHARGSF